MKAQVESISPVKTRLSVEISPEKLNEEEEAALRDLRRSVSVPGFRKGKTPLDVLKRRFGSRVRSDVVGRLIQESYAETLRDHDIFPVSDADIELQPSATEGGIAYTAVIEVRPKVEPRNYRDRVFRKARVEVDQTDVEAQLEKLRADKATFEPAPEGHAAGKDDMVVIDYEGSIDGEPFEGGRGEDRPLVLGSGNLVPGFEEGLVGATAGEERTLDVAFPEDYHAENLAGRSAQFRIQVKDIKTRVLPDLDDEFAKEVGGLGSLEELRDAVRDAIRSEREAEAARQLRQQVIDALLEANPFEVPESLVRDQQSRSLQRLRSDLENRGHDPEALGIGKPEVQEAHRRGAERAVRWAFLLQAIAKAEGIAATDGDVDDRIRAIAEADGRPTSLIRSFFEEQDQIDSLRSSILERKVADWVVEAGTVEEVEASDLEQEGNRE